MPAVVALSGPEPGSRVSLVVGAEGGWAAVSSVEGFNAPLACLIPAAARLAGWESGIVGLLVGAEDMKVMGAGTIGV